MKIEVYEIISSILSKKDELIKFFDLCSKGHEFDVKSKVFKEDLVNGNLQKVCQVFNDCPKIAEPTDFGIKIASTNYEYDFALASSSSIPLYEFNAEIAFNELRPDNQKTNDYLIALSLFVNGPKTEIISEL